MVLRLYGSPLSVYVHLVAFILSEKKVAFELVPIDFSKKEHKSPEYLEKRPFGQVPYIACEVLFKGIFYWLNAIVSGWWWVHTPRKQGYLLLYRLKVP